MMQKLPAVFIIVLVILVSISVMIAPTFTADKLSRVSTNKEFDLPLVLNDDKKIKLLFFGYAGCADICAPRLQSINEIYNSLSKEIKKEVGVEFIDISIPDDKTLPSRFAQYFNKDFKGIYLDNKTLRDYTKAFDVYFARSLMEATDYDHTSHLYLVSKDKDKKSIRYIYNSYPYNIKQIKKDIQELLNE